jgi:hypothetical protein
VLQVSCFVFVIFSLFRVVVYDVFYGLCVTTMCSICLRYVGVVGKDFCLFYVFVCITVLVRFYSHQLRFFFCCLCCYIVIIVFYLYFCIFWY